MMSLSEREGGSVLAFAPLDKMGSIQLSPLGAGHFDLLLLGDPTSTSALKIEFRIPEDSYWTQDVWLEELSARAKAAKARMGDLLAHSMPGTEDTFDDSDDEEDDWVGEEPLPHEEAIKGGFEGRLRKKGDKKILGKYPWNSRWFNITEKRANKVHVEYDLEYRAKRAGKLRGQLPLQAITQVTSSDSRLWIYFQWSGINKIFSLDAEKEIIAQEWVKQLHGFSVTVRELKLAEEADKRGRLPSAIGKALGGRGKKKTGKPKVIILGLDQSGKTVLTQAMRLKLQPENKSLARPSLIYNATVGFSATTLLNATGRKYELVDVGGMDMLRTMWPRYFPKCDALVWVVDASDEDRLDEDEDDCSKLEFATVLESKELSGVPVLVVANKQDLPGSLSADMVADRLNAAHVCGPRAWACLETDALKGTGVAEVLAWLADCC